MATLSRSLTRWLSAPGRPRASLCSLSVSLLLGLMAGEAHAESKLAFNRDIRPILSDKCFFCHGPDAKKREAGLRLDTAEGASVKSAIVPGSPEKSKILSRITSQDPEEHMPPPKSKLPSLTPTEVETLRRWIAEGATFEAHWSFIPLRDNPIPAVEPGESRHPVDAFVSAKLHQRGLRLQPPAAPEVLARRLSFDLTGLPPAPEDVAQFKAAYAMDPALALSKWVDRLLQSPRFGERWAADWLDVARYADSYGFQVDRERDVWMWRDWVVKAFNQNLPFDQFITWQIAGDLIPGATDEQILATAFSRLHQQESEGGSVEEEYRVEYVADRVQTFATAFLGLTFECARCHDHKYDPVSQKDYYGLFSMFQNIDEAGLYSYFTTSPPTPALMLMDAPAKDKMRVLQGDVDARERTSRQAFESGLATPPQAPSAAPGKVAIPGELAHFTFDVLETNKLANLIKPDQPAVLRGENKLVTGRFGQAVEFTGDDAVSLSLGNFRRHEPFSVSLWMKTPNRKDRAVVFHRSAAWTDAASRGYECLIEEGKLKWSLIHFWPGNAISVRAVEAVPLNEWIHVAVSSDGSSRADGLKLYVNGKRAAVEVIRDALTKDITGGGGDNITLGERFRDRGFKGGAIDEFRVFGRELTDLEVEALVDEASVSALLAKPLDSLDSKQRERVARYRVSTGGGEYAARLAELQKARGAVTEFSDSIKEIMVMKELPQPKKAYVLFRGEYNQRRDEVGPGVPASLGPIPAGAPRNRLGVAQWLTDPKHPLTARVTVNRFWQSLFGRGLVKTAEDFGSQGARPLYPEVLDWLAMRWIQSGWDTKQLLRNIVLSQTYLQDSLGSKAMMEDDPENEWLSRGPRLRLPAEMIRDNALAVAGLLEEKIGGPPIDAYESSESFKPLGPSGGGGVYRRSVYMNWRRTSPPPAMLAFDAPRRAVCASKRERTDSPLQALILLNGVQYVEAARVLGERLHVESGGDVDRMVERGFLACLSRPPDSSERRIALRLYSEQAAHFEAHPQAAEELLKTGNRPRNTRLKTSEAAAATVLAQALLNHDACVVKR